VLRSVLKNELTGDNRENRDSAFSSVSSVCSCSKFSSFIRVSSVFDHWLTPLGYWLNTFHAFEPVMDVQILEDFPIFFPVFSTLAHLLIEIT
jgi:hypothetical protein